jgi:hypothetical protein
MIWSAFEPSFAQQRLGVWATAKPFGPMTKHTVHLRTVSRVVGLTVQGESLRPEISSLPFSRE